MHTIKIPMSDEAERRLYIERIVNLLAQFDTVYVTALYKAMKKSCGCIRRIAGNRTFCES